MALLTGMTEDGREVPVQVDASGRLVAEGLAGPAGAQGPAGQKGDPGATGPVGPVGPASDLSTFKGGSSARPGLTPEGSAGTGLFSLHPNQVGVSTSGLERIRVIENGNIGINTATPADRIHVIGAADDAKISFQNYSGYAKFGVSAEGNARVGMFTSNRDLELWSGGAERLRVYGSGDVLIGGVDPGTAAVRFTQGGDVRAAGVANRVHADNAAARAAGLGSGDFYRQTNGTLMIAF
jgi:hypothetical protein